MQVTETLSQGLKREFQVVLPVKELEGRLSSELETLKGRVRINGFRPGKVPTSHLRRLYGRSVMADVVQNMVNEVNQKIISDNSLKLAHEPRIEFPEDKAELEKVMDAKSDLTYKVALEILPVFELVDLKGTKLNRQVADVSDESVNEAIERLAKRNRIFEAKEGKSADGDRVVIDFVGKVDGVAFDGGRAESIPVDIGTSTFIPGFEEQLIGVAAGEEKVLKVRFPDDYDAPNLAGKDAEFDVKVVRVEAGKDAVIDDEMAKTFGLESLDALKDNIRQAMQRDFDSQSRNKVKKELFDALDGKYSFELPPSLVEQEFSGVWSQVEADLSETGRTFADENTTEEEAREEYRRISERRVRLGLVLAKMGEEANVQISDEELSQALIERVRMFPGQERMVWDYYRKNPQAMTEIRAPLFEEKVVDLLLAQTEIIDHKVSREELFKDETETEEKSKKPQSEAKAEKADAKSEKAAEAKAADSSERPAAKKTKASKAKD